jgi:hypothetical protein
MFKDSKKRGVGVVVLDGTRRAAGAAPRCSVAGVCMSSLLVQPPPALQTRPTGSVLEPRKTTRPSDPASGPLRSGLRAPQIPSDPADLHPGVHRSRSGDLDLVERLLDVRPDVVEALDADREAHQVVADADLGALLGALGGWVGSSFGWSG